MEGYTRVKQIGKGNMGVCHLAKNKEGGLVVLKQVHIGKMGKKEKAQATSEANVLKSLRHPNIVGYIDSWVTKSDNLMISMEYVAKGDLCDKIHKTRNKQLWKETQVLDWFIQIALAVNHAGAKHILHRDLKTQNILVSEDNIMKLADFGISRSLVNTWDQAHTFVGTPYYLAPELVLQQPYNIQVDAWALGVVLCEMLTLSHPFTGFDMKSLTSNIVRGIYTKPSSHYSTQIRSLVSSLLQKDPRKRMTVKGALQSNIVQNRLKQWLTSAATEVPKSYLSDLITNDCLAGVVPEILLNEHRERASADRSPRTPRPPQNAEAILSELERQRSAEKKRIKSEFSKIDKISIPEPTPSAAASPVGRKRSGLQLPPIPGAYPGHVPSSHVPSSHPAHPRELLAEKRRVLAMLEQQQHRHNRPGSRYRNKY